MKEKEEVAWLFAAERAKRKNFAVVEQLTKDVSAVTMKAGEQVGAPTASLEQLVKEFGELMKEREIAIRALGELCEGMKCVEYASQVAS